MLGDKRFVVLGSTQLTESLNFVAERDGGDAGDDVVSGAVAPRDPYVLLHPQNPSRFSLDRLLLHCVFLAVG